MYASVCNVLCVYPSVLYLRMLVVSVSVRVCVSIYVCVYICECIFVYEYVCVYACAVSVHSVCVRLG